MGGTSPFHFMFRGTTKFPFFVLPFSGKLVSPKWKNFKGLKLQWRDKIRLNNAIWRAWYMQCECYPGFWQEGPAAAPEALRWVGPPGSQWCPEPTFQT